MDLDPLDDDETRRAGTAALEDPHPDQIRVDNERYPRVAQRPGRDRILPAVRPALAGQRADRPGSPAQGPRLLGRGAGRTASSQILVERGHLDEADASMVDALASDLLALHHGIPWESLIALGRSVRFRLDPGEVGDSALRVILAGFTEGPAGDRQPNPDGSARVRLAVTRSARITPVGAPGSRPAWHHDLEIHREVAVKEIRAEYAHHADYRARFLREAEVTGRLEHPGSRPGLWDGPPRRWPPLLHH